MVIRTALRVARFGWQIARPPITRRVVQLREHALLSPHASRSVLTRGRISPEPLCPYRTVYARDRDRIIHSRYYMLLAGKTQVLSPESLTPLEKQRIHNRLFHVMKVAQIARDICRALGLNEDLAEAIALGHDLGHSPFGHEGEGVLSRLSMEHLGIPFKHNRQSLRVVDEIERLNLTFEVRDGIVRHDGEKKDRVIVPFRQSPGNDQLDDSEFPTTLEGCVVRLADRIAYLPTDLEDAILLSVISRDQIPRIVQEVLGTTAGDIIDVLVKDVIATSARRNYIAVSERVYEALDVLFEFNYKYIYFSDLKARHLETIEETITELFKYYTKTAGMSPQAAIDAIVGMTDQEALAVV